MKLDHLVLLASDLAKSTKHYAVLLKRLGFDKTRDCVWVNEDGMAIDLRSAKDGLDYARYAPGLNHLAFSANSRAEFDQVLSDLADSGIDVPPVQVFPQGVAVFIPDPDGLRLEISCDGI